MDNKNIGINLNILELNGPNFERKEKKKPKLWTKFKGPKCKVWKFGDQCGEKRNLKKTKDVRLH